MPEGFSEQSAGFPAPLPGPDASIEMFQLQMAFSELQHLVNTEIQRFMPYQPQFIDTADGQRLKVLGEPLGTAGATGFWRLIDGGNGETVILKPAGANIRLNSGDISRHGLMEITGIDAAYTVADREMLFLELTRTTGQDLTAAVLTLKNDVPPDYWPQPYDFDASTPPQWIAYCFPLYEFALQSSLPESERDDYQTISTDDKIISIIPRHSNSPLDVRLTLYENPDTQEVGAVPVFVPSHASCIYV